MTRNTDPISILAGPRRGAVLAVALVVLALLGAVAAAGTATAQGAQPTVVVTDGTVSTDGTTTVGVVLMSAPNGLSGYYLDVSVESPETAAIESARYPDRFGLTSDPTIGTGGATITLEAADVEGALNPGATNVTLATVTIAGTSPGEVVVTVRPRQFDDDSGNVFTPTTHPGAVTVSESGTAGASTSGPDGGETTSNSGTAVGTTSPAAGEDSGESSTGDTGATSVSQPLSPILPVIALVTIGGLVYLFNRGRNQ